MYMGIRTTNESYSSANDPCFCDKYPVGISRLDNPRSSMHRICSSGEDKH